MKIRVFRISHINAWIMFLLALVYGLILVALQFFEFNEAHGNTNVLLWLFWSTLIQSLFLIHHLHKKESYKDFMQDSSVTWIFGSVIMMGLHNIATICILLSALAIVTPVSLTFSWVSLFATSVLGWFMLYSAGRREKAKRSKKKEEADFQGRVHSRVLDT